MKRRALPEQDLQRALNAVREVYADLSRRPIERNCLRVKECCHFKLTGRTPYLTKGEALLAARAVRATGRTQLPENAAGACPMLDSANGNCLIYEARPFGCRTHFCATAGGPYARREVIDLIRRLEAIDVEVGGSGPRSLTSAISLVLDQV
jgi:Fe-S-cluster containining protein